MPRHAEQLSFHVAPHPAVRDEDAPSYAELAVPKFELPVGANYQPGTGLVVTVAGPDGDVIGSVHMEVRHVSFPPVEARDVGIIGTMRRHHVKQSND